MRIFRLVSSRCVVFLAVGSLLLFAGCDKLKELAGAAYIQWECNPADFDAVTCTFHNTGDAPGEACFDLVIVCDGKRHVASKCSGKLTVGGKTSKVVTGFKPPILRDSRCVGMEFENERVE